MTARAALYGLLTLVAASAAVLSFTALRDLALACGFIGWTAPLLPLVVDAGAAAGSLAWLYRDGRARLFGRALALTLLVLSVGGNAVGHALAAFAQRPHWALVVAVSAVAPAVLGAVVHLAVLSGRELLAESAERADDEHADEADEHDDDLVAQARRIVEGSPQKIGRNRLARELEVSQHQARQILEQLSTNGAAR